MPLTYTSISFFQFLQCCLHVRIVFTKNVNIYRVHVLLPLVSTAASCCSTFWHACCVFDHRNMPFNSSSEATRVAKSKIAANVSLTDRSDLLHMTLSVFFPLEPVSQARSHGLWVVQTTFRAIFLRNQVMNSRQNPSRYRRQLCYQARRWRDLQWGVVNQVLFVFQGRYVNLKREWFWGWLSWIVRGISFHLRFSFG